MFKLLLLLCFFVSCSTNEKRLTPKVEKNSFSKKEKEHFKKLKNKIKYSRSLSDLVGCSKAGVLDLSQNDKKRLDYLVLLEAERLGGDMLSEVSEFKRREKPSGETIFTQGENRYFFKSDVYRCK
jgi:hypothetical protein